MSKITLDEFCAHWVPGKWTTAMASRLENNAFDFATVAGEYAKVQFQASFAAAGFNGKRWAPRTSRWGRKFSHPVMNDTGALARGIEGEAKRVDIVGRRADRTRIFRKGAYYWIHTTEKSTPERGKRGRKKGRYQNYAAVHNTDPKFGLYTVNQYSSRRPEHRPFIGFSPKIDGHIASHFTDMIFKGFPGV